MKHKCIFFIAAFLPILSNIANADVVRIPVTYFEHEVPVIELDLLGEKRLFILDTGFAHTMALAPADIERIRNSLVVTKPERTINIAGIVTESKRFIFKNYQSNDLKVSNTIIIEGNDWATTVNGDGSVISADSPLTKGKYPIAGRGLFDDYLTVFDFKKNEIMLFSGPDRDKYIASNNLKVINGDINKNGIEIHAEINKQEIVLLLDTGSTVSVVKQLGTHTYGIKDACHNRHPDIEDKSCYIGLFQYDNKGAKHPILVWDNALKNYVDDGLLGMDNIRNTKFAIDFVDKKIWVLPTNG